ncbi:hypothetical protein OHD18_26320 [Escherichia coli]|nr:hypothetical protein [Escherichia coli]MCW7185423.1 hypothetical protein [Escherichia coli]
MTFCGDLPFVPSGIHHHLFENLRRMGHHCHGLTHLSWAERKIFYRVLGKKFCGLFIYPDSQCGRLWLYQPRRQGLKQVNGTDRTTGRDPPQRREARFAKRRCALHPGVFLPGCRERRPRRDRAARPERSLQARGFHASDRSGSPKPRQRVRRRLAGAPAAACRSRA